MTNTPDEKEVAEALRWYESGNCVCYYGGGSQCSCKRDPRGKIIASSYRSSQARVKAMEKAYKAHRAEFNHLADCPKCEKAMTSLCPEWEKLAV